MKVDSLDPGHPVFYVGTHERTTGGQNWGEAIVRESVAGATTRIGLRARATLSPVAHTMWLRYGG